MKERATGLIRTGGGGGGGGRGNMRENVLRIIDGFNREGMTGAKDLNVSQAKWDLYKELLDEGKLNVRVAVLWRGGNTIESARQAQASTRNRKLPGTLGNGRLVNAVSLHRRKRRPPAELRRLEQGPHRTDTATMHPRMENLGCIQAASPSAQGRPGFSRAQPSAIAASTRVDLCRGVEGSPSRAAPSIIHSNHPHRPAMRTMAALQRPTTPLPEARGRFSGIGDTYAVTSGRRGIAARALRLYVNHGVIWASGPISVTPTRRATDVGVVGPRNRRRTTADSFRCRRIDRHPTALKRTRSGGPTAVLETQIVSLEAEAADIATGTGSLQGAARALKTSAAK